MHHDSPDRICENLHELRFPAGSLAESRAPVVRRVGACPRVPSAGPGRTARRSWTTAAVPRCTTATVRTEPQHHAGPAPRRLRSSDGGAATGHGGLRKGAGPRGGDRRRRGRRGGQVPAPVDPDPVGDRAERIGVRVSGTSAFSAASASSIPNPYRVSFPGSPASFAVLTIRLMTWWPLMSGHRERIRAATPATMGVAPEVPAQSA